MLCLIMVILIHAYLTPAARDFLFVLILVILDIIVCLKKKFILDILFFY